MEKVLCPDPQLLRRVAGGFPTGVTVICVERENGSVTGMTASSFVSLSLDPPLVMFSVMNKADFLNHCSIGKCLGISILSTDQKDISNQFARQNQDNIIVNFDSKAKYHCIQNALGWYHTQVKKIIAAGDHQLVICQVQDLSRNESKEPLIYYSGYRTVGNSID